MSHRQSSRARFLDLRSRFKARQLDEVEEGDEKSGPQSGTNDAMETADQDAERVLR